MALLAGLFFWGNLTTVAAMPLPQKKPQQVEDQTATLDEKIPAPLHKPDHSEFSNSDEFAISDIFSLLNFQKYSNSAPPPVPKQKPLGKAGTMLSVHDAQTYTDIFAYQARGNWEKADELINTLSDFRLRGHILYQRYMHPTSYKASFEELAGWLDNYADLAGAPKIYDLALKRQPENYNGSLQKPIKTSGINGYLDILAERTSNYYPPQKHPVTEQQKIDALEKSIRHELSRGNPAGAHKKLKASKTAQALSAAEFDQLQAQIASSFLISGKIERAKQLALSSAKRSGNKVPLAGWVAGLSAWQLGHYKLAASLFETTASSSYSSEWTAAAGAYWASRAHMRAGNIKEVSIWLKQAAKHPRTFYGLIATRALGWNFDFNWDVPHYSDSYKTALLKYPAAQRAMLLIETGQYHLADKELRQIKPTQKKELTPALLAYASQTGLPSYAMRLAAAVKTPEGGLYDAGLYPLLPWEPKGGYKVDRALIHALIRQESKFDPEAQNHSGATGLMQLMPATANYVAKQNNYSLPAGQHSLKEPQINLDIGQRYVQSLLRQEQIEEELFSLVIAYNAGPGNLRKWKKQQSKMKDDPLLFVETVPMSETRAFVERVMANYWIYRLRLKQPTPSLDAVAAGDWARYVQLDNVKKAENTTAYKVANR